MSYPVSRTDLLKAVALLQYASSRLARSPQQRDVQRAYTMKRTATRKRTASKKAKAAAKVATTRKSTIARQLWQAGQIGRLADANRLTDLFIKILRHALVSGSPVALRGFGTLKVVRAAAKNCNDFHHSGERILKPAHATVRFKPSPELLTLLNLHDDEFVI